MPPPFRTLPGGRQSRVLLTCEHASCEVPEEYAGLGVAEERLRDHIGWDIGAAQVTEFLSGTFAAPAVLSGYSRLLIDCNRGLDDHDLIVEESDGVRVPGNVGLTPAERQRRMRAYYEPYHRTVGEELAAHPNALLLSVHSFTPVFRGRARPFDVGVLFQDYREEAEKLGKGLQKAGFEVRYNEPYSGFDGLIYSARAHGLQHGRCYLELEINNRLLRTATGVREVSGRVASALRRLLEGGGC